MAVRYHDYKAHFFTRSGWGLDGFQVCVKSKRGRKGGRERGRNRGREEERGRERGRKGKQEGGGGMGGTW